MRTLWQKYENHAYVGVALAAVALPWMLSLGIWLALR